MSRQLCGALLSPVLGQRLVLFLARDRATDDEQLTRLIEVGELARPSTATTRSSGTRCRAGPGGGSDRGNVTVTV